MVVMVLDHVRDFFMDLRVDPTDLSRSEPALFFTRWVTHFCAPVFVFLAGAGAFLACSGGKSRGGLARYLIARGLWLIVLEETWVRFSVFFSDPKVVIATVLWAIGWSLVALAGLIFLGPRVCGGVGVAMIALHNTLDGAYAGEPSLLWHVLHQPGRLPLPGGFMFFIVYPLIPWIGVMAAGYAFGELLLLPPTGRRRALLALGFSLTLSFVVLRGINRYGDPTPWAARESPVFAAMSFLNCQKYPPSLLYLLMTLGPAILILVALERGAGWLTGPLLTFGRVPLFYYLAQWPLVHALAVIVAALRGFPTAWLFRCPPFQSPPGYGVGLSIVYLMWLVAVAMLYPPCRWFAALKRRHGSPWLRYL
jgi:uncharacterized membrane protein